MKKAIFSTMTLLFLVGGYMFYYHFHILPKDIKNFEKNFNKKKEIQEMDQSEQSSRQTKKYSEKDIWQSSSSGRLHSKIIAEEGYIYIESGNNRLKMHESMKNITCLIQESPALDGYQNIRVLTAPLGAYDYDSHTFTSKKVFVNLYRVPFQDELHYPLNHSPYLHGIGYYVSILFKDHLPQFEALSFKADIDSLKPTALK